MKRYRPAGQLETLAVGFGVGLVVGAAVGACGDGAGDFRLVGAAVPAAILLSTLPTRTTLAGALTVAAVAEACVQSRDVAPIAIFEEVLPQAKHITDPTAAAYFPTGHA